MADSEKEIWKDIPNYSAYYKVSSCGRIKSFHHNKNGRLLKNSIYNTGYLYVDLCKKTKKTRFLVHRIVAFVFIDNHYTKPCVNHIDGNKKNNTKNNLEWVTYKENQQHAFDTGLHKMPKGELSPNSKISFKEVLQIRSKYDSGNFTQKQIGCEYGISQMHVSDIVNYKYRNNS